ncbi:MAG: hypothetical protein BWY49_00211 [Candidatus Omnitrophica bacterium ADurb.Bin314]|nr:MAG: hypothetical protein BWY49_00211 [Candidatus Omnitrophica bacterium ADurb.Bin314]
MLHQPGKIVEPFGALQLGRFNQGREDLLCHCITEKTLLDPPIFIQRPVYLGGLAFHGRNRVFQLLISLDRHGLRKPPIENFPIGQPVRLMDGRLNGRGNDLDLVERPRTAIRENHRLCPGIDPVDLPFRQSSPGDIRHLNPHAFAEHGLRPVRCGVFIGIDQRRLDRGRCGVRVRFIEITEITIFQRHGVLPIPDREHNTFCLFIDTLDGVLRYLTAIRVDAVKDSAFGQFVAFSVHRFPRGRPLGPRDFGFYRRGLGKRNRFVRFTVHSNSLFGPIRTEIAIIVPRSFRWSGRPRGRGLSDHGIITFLNRIHRLIVPQPGLIPQGISTLPDRIGQRFISCDTHKLLIRILKLSQNLVIMPQEHLVGTFNPCLRRQ